MLTANKAKTKKCLPKRGRFRLPTLDDYTLLLQQNTGLLAPLHIFQHKQLLRENLVDSSKLNWAWHSTNCSSYSSVEGCFEKP